MAAARADLEKFEAQTEKLKAALEEHTGRPWRVDDRRDARDVSVLVGLPAPKDAHLRHALATLIDQQARLRAQFESVAPLTVADAQLAAASVRLLQVSGAISATSKANVLACADALRAEADAHEDRRGTITWQLKESFLENRRGTVAPGSLDEFVVHDWVPDIARAVGGL
jgi:hypothetical protein